MSSHPMTSQQFGMLPAYISTREAAQVLGVLFLFTAAVSWLAVGFDYAALRLTSAVVAGAAVDPVERLAHGMTGRWVSAFQIVCFAMTGLAFIAWLFRARVNVRAMGMRRMKYRREWTVAGFLVPVLNIVRPYQVVCEVWKTSDPSTCDPMGWKNVRTPPLLPAWWITFLLYVTCEILAATLVGSGAGLRRLRLAYSLELFGDVSAAVSASLAYFVVMGISEAQERKRSLSIRGFARAEANVYTDRHDAVA
ncbi:MAG: DUF4328 domain-containing protein [Myxococcales bacterium]|nr:DUF4328 domain-containing protein [Myxococcales bacterium]